MYRYISRYTIITVLTVLGSHLVSGGIAISSLMNQSRKVRSNQRILIWINVINLVVAMLLSEWETKRILKEVHDK